MSADERGRPLAVDVSGPGLRGSSRSLRRALTYPPWVAEAPHDATTDAASLDDLHHFVVRIFACVFVIGIGAAIGLGCSKLPAAEPPPPIVERAPKEVATLAVHVFQLAQPPVLPEDDWDYHHMPGYTGELRRLFQSQLQQAGFTVILDRATPADLVATIQSDMPHEKPGVATLVVKRQGEIVDRISVAVRVSGRPPNTVHHVEEAAVRLVEAMSKSAAVLAVARDVAARRSKPAPSSDLAIAAAPSDLPVATEAGAPCPPPREAPLFPEPQPPRVECMIERSARCQPPSPVRSAWQSPPFVQCPSDLPGFIEGDLLKGPARFSARDTRARRLAGACGPTPEQGECCYVQFTARACR